MGTPTNVGVTTPVLEETCVYKPKWLPMATLTSCGSVTFELFCMKTYSLVNSTFAVGRSLQWMLHEISGWGSYSCL